VLHSVCAVCTVPVRVLHSWPNTKFYSSVNFLSFFPLFYYRYILYALRKYRKYFSFCVVAGCSNWITLLYFIIICARLFHFPACIIIICNTRRRLTPSLQITAAAARRWWTLSIRKFVRVLEMNNNILLRCHNNIIYINWCATENHSRVLILCCCIFASPKKGVYTFFYSHYSKYSPGGYYNNRTFLWPTGLVVASGQQYKSPSYSCTNTTFFSLELDIEY